MNIKDYWVYILHCENDSYYTGYTTDIEKRFQAHLTGKGSKYTRSFKPVNIVFSLKMYCDRSLAMRIERAIKKLSRSQKEKLIANPSLLSEICNTIN